MMDRSKLIEILNEIEKKFPVSYWKVDDIDIWPIIKIRLFFYHFGEIIKNDEDSKSISKTRINIKSVGALANSYFSFLKFIFVKLRKSDFLFSEAKTYYTLLNGENVNKFFFPLESFVNNKCDKFPAIVRTSHGENLPKNSYKNTEIMSIRELVKPLLIFSYIKDKIWLKYDYSQLPEISLLFQFLLKNNLNPSPDLPSFYSYINLIVKEIKAYQVIYRKILLDTKPSLVLELCYYSKANFALNIEARKLAIPTLEIMHGGMGNLHVAYANWGNNLPVDGYNVLPQKIWVWDQASKDLLDSWMCKQTFHSTFIGGQPWLDFILQKRNDYKEIFINRKRIILYTLQFDSIDDYIYEAICNSGNEYEWWLRLHPRKPHAKENILKKLKQLGISNKVNIEEANNIPLPIILSNSYIHLSEFSGSIIEACLLGIQSIILSKVGLETYQLYVDMGICKVILDQDASKLIKMINKVDNKVNINLNAPSYEKLIEKFYRVNSDIL